MVCGKLPSLSPDLQLHRPVGLPARRWSTGIHVAAETSGLSLEARDGREAGKRRDGRRLGAGPAFGDHIAQPSGELIAPEPQPDLLEHLANRRIDQIDIACLATAAGQRHVAGPWISRTIGATDQKERIGGGNQDERHRGPEQLGIGVIGGWWARREALPELLKARLSGCASGSYRRSIRRSAGGPSRLGRRASRRRRAAQ